MRWKVAAVIAALATFAIASPTPRAEAGSPRASVLCYESAPSENLLWAIVVFGGPEIASNVQSCIKDWNGVPRVERL